MNNNISRALKIIDELRSLVNELESCKGSNSARNEAIDKLIAIKTAELDIQEKIVDFYNSKVK